MTNHKKIIDHLDDYMDFLEIEKGLSPKTQENYTRFLNKFFLWLKDNNLDNILPSKLTDKNIWAYRVFLSRHIDPIRKQPLQKNTQNCYLIALRGLLEYFVEKDIPCLPPDKIKLAKEKSQKKIKFLSLKQVEDLLLSPNIGNIKGLRDRVILEVLFSTGLRVAELAALNREQFKITDKTKDLEIAVVGKGKKVRAVYFSERAIEWLRKYLLKRNDIDEALFINYARGYEKTNNSRRLTIKSIERIVKKYVKITGLPIMTSPHTLRHSYATDLLAQGVDLRLVQEFLGHSNISTTQIYTHVTNKQLKDVHKKHHSGKRMKN